MVIAASSVCSIVISQGMAVVSGTGVVCAVSLLARFTSKYESLVVSGYALEDRSVATNRRRNVT